jgi:hypothetical protein
MNGTACLQPIYQCESCMYENTTKGSSGSVLVVTGLCLESLWQRPIAINQSIDEPSALSSVLAKNRWNAAACCHLLREANMICGQAGQSKLVQ